MRSKIRAAGGFTLIDMMVTIAILGVLLAIAVPALNDVSRAMRLGQAARDIERDLQTARLRAVATNRAMRVRFNCPAAGTFRMVELIGTPSTPAAADTDANRCDDTVYRYPAPDVDPMTLPNHDGPVRRLQPTVTFNAVQTVEFWPDGTAHVDVTGATPWPVISGTGIGLVVQQINGSVTTTKSITVNGLGKIQLQ